MSFPQSVHAVEELIWCVNLMFLKHIKARTLTYVCVSVGERGLSVKTLLPGRVLFVVIM